MSQQFRTDTTAIIGLANVMQSVLSNRVTGLGTSRDKGSYTQVNTLVSSLTEKELNGLYRKNGVIQRACTTYPNDAIQAGWNLNFTDGSDRDIAGLNKYFEAMPGYSLKAAIRKACFYSRLHGDGYIVLGAVDGGDTEEPLNLNNIKSLRWLLPLSPNYLKPIGDYSLPSHYEITRLENTSGTRIHESRVIRIIGVELDDWELKRNQGRNDSVIQGFWASFCAFYPGLQSASIMVQDHRTRTRKIQGLNDLLRQDINDPSNKRKNQTEIENRILASDIQNSTGKTTVIDSTEDIEDIVNNYGGLAGVLEQLKDAWASDADMSRIYLFNLIGVSGLQSGEAYKMARQDHAYRLNSWMNVKLNDPISKIYRTAIAAKDSPINNDGEWEIEFPLLYKMTPLERIEFQTKAAERDEKYLAMGVFTKEEIRRQFYQPMPDFHITLDEDLDIEAIAEDETEDNEQKYITQRSDGSWLVFFHGRRTGIAVNANDRNEAIRKARKKKKRGGNSATARQMTVSEIKTASKGRWVRTGANHEKPGESNLRGYGPIAKKHRKDSFNDEDLGTELPEPSQKAIQSAKAAIALVEKNGLQVNEDALGYGRWLASLV